jgi:hypothetical protein
LDSCKRGNKVSRNTIAVGVVVLNHLLERGIVEMSDVVSPGGEIKGARSGLPGILDAHGIPESFLREVTTRQAHPDGKRLFGQFQWGRAFDGLNDSERGEIILPLIEHLKTQALGWLNRQNLKFTLDRSCAPTKWISIILEGAIGRSTGVVEQHLIGAKLQRLFPHVEVPNHPAHAADTQTSREGDFALFECVYHVTAAPSRGVIDKCNSNLKTGKHPILLVPKIMEYRARALAQEEGIDSRITLLSIEDFLSVNIIEIAASEAKDFFSVLREIVAIYNDRLGKAETDLSLRIEIR